MITMFKSIVETITALVTFIIHSILSLFYLLYSLPSYIVFLTSAINVLPAVIVPFAIASVSTYVMFLILARNK